MTSTSYNSNRPHPTPAPEPEPESDSLPSLADIPAPNIARHDPQMVSRTEYGVTRVRGLTVDQRRFLGARPLHATDEECALALKPPLHQHTPHLWRSQSPLFAAAYDTLWDDGIEYGKAEARRLLGKAISRAEALLDAESPVRTKAGIALDAEGHPITAPDWMAQAKGVEMLLRANSMWQPEARAEVANPNGEALAALRDIIALRRLELEQGQGRNAQQATALTPTTIIDVTPARTP